MNMISSILMLVALVCLIVSNHLRAKSEREIYKKINEHITLEIEKLNKSLDRIIIKLDKMISK